MSTAFQEFKEHWQRQVTAEPKIPGSALKVANAIGWHLNHNSREAWPSLKKLAELAGITKRSAIRGIQWLEAQRHVGVTRVARRGRGNVNRYMPILSKRNGDSRVTFSPREMVTAVTVNGDSRGREMVTAVSPEPSIEPSIEPTAKGRRDRLLSEEESQKRLFELLKRESNATKVLAHRLLKKYPSSEVLAVVCDAKNSGAEIDDTLKAVMGLWARAAAE
jgi:hypothetical protein